MWKGVFFLALLGGVTGEILGSEPREVPLPERMAVLGDSISEAILSDFSLEYKPSFRQLVSMLLMIRHLKDVQIGIEIIRKKYARPQWSWASGEDPSDFVFSHYERLKEYVPNLKAWNFSRARSKAKHLKGQVQLLLEKEQKEGSPMDYVTLFIGVNDLQGHQLKDITPSFVYERYIAEALYYLLQQSSKRSILIIGIPKILEIFKVSADIPAHQFLTGSIDCSEMRKMIYGKELIFDSAEDEKIYSHFEQVIGAYQESLERIGEKLRQDFPEAHVQVVTDLPPPRSTYKILSIDCFHPSQWGQAELAEITWSRGFWPHL